MKDVALLNRMNKSETETSYLITLKVRKSKLDIILPIGKMPN
jgi:hypothetical protein